MIKSRKLYYEHPEQNKFEARVMGIRDNGVVLDQTLFYPKGGYQGSDQGIIEIAGAKIPVLDVFEDKGEIIHVVSNLPSVSEGDLVYGEVDYERRVYLSLLHTAQHAISRIVFNKWYINTLRSNFSENGGEIVFSKPIQQKELQFIEDELIKLALKRKKITCNLEDDFRQVIIPEFDCSPCGGTHLSNTSYLEDVYLIGTERNKLLFDGGKKGFERLKSSRRDIFNIEKNLGKPKNCLQTIYELQRNYILLKKKFKNLDYEMLKQKFKSPKKQVAIDQYKIALITKEFIKSKCMKRYLAELKKHREFDLYVIAADNQLTLLSFSQLINSSDIVLGLKKMGLVKTGGGNHKKADCIIDNIACEVLFEKVLEVLNINICD